MAAKLPVLYEGRVIGHASSAAEAYILAMEQRLGGGERLDLRREPTAWVFVAFGRAAPPLPDIPQSMRWRP